MPTTSLRLDPEAASFEDFGDEIVVIHNQSGVFYSLKGRAIGVWRALGEGLDESVLEERIRSLDAQESEALRRMLEEFRSRAVILPADASTGGIDEAEWTALGAASFESNSDFDDLIRLDPIHDVDDSGWPHRKPDAE